MRREPSPIADLRALLRVTVWMRRQQVQTLVYGTPKAALLCSVAGFLNRVPNRYFILHGLRHETLKNPMRWIVRTTDHLASLLSTQTVCVSPSLHQAALREGVTTRDRSIVMGSGSLAGIDTERFRPATASERDSVRRELGVHDDRPIIGFIGRLAKDKGIEELTASLELIRADVTPLLVIAGPTDETDPLMPITLERIRGSRHIVYLGEIDSPETLLRGFDIFAFPSYREGIGLAALEAAATGLPVVASDVTGARDTVVSSVTGLLVPPADAEHLAIALTQLLADPIRAVDMGTRGREYALSHYERSGVLSHWKVLLERATGVESTLNSEAR